MKRQSFAFASVALALCAALGVSNTAQAATSYWIERTYTSCEKLSGTYSYYKQATLGGHAAYHAQLDGTINDPCYDGTYAVGQVSYYYWDSVEKAWDYTGWGEFAWAEDGERNSADWSDSYVRDVRFRACAYTGGWVDC